MPEPHKEEFDWDAFHGDTCEASVAAVGAWARCLYKMRRSVTRGRVSWPMSTYARLFGTSVEQAKVLIDEISALGIGDADQESNGNVTLTNRRIYRAWETAESARLRQQNRRIGLKEVETGDACHASVTNEQENAPSSLKKEDKNKKEEKRASRTKTDRDPRLDHPAIIAVLNACGRYPFKELWDTIIEIVGVNPDFDLLKKCWIAWRTRNYKPTNFGWLMDWYREGGPPNPPGNNNGTNQYGGSKPTNREKLERTAEIISQYPTEAELQEQEAAERGEDSGSYYDHQQTPPA